VISFKGGCRSASRRRTGLGKDFVSLVAYLTRGRPHTINPERVAWTSCRNIEGLDDPARIAQLMRAHASEHRRTKKPVYHFGLSLHASEHLSAEQWNQAVDQVLRRLGLGGHQALIVAHRDTANEHVHVVVNRAGDDGPTWHRHDDIYKMRDAVGRIELAYGLIPHPVRDLPAPELTSGAYQEALHTGHQPLADRVRDQAAAAFAEATGWCDLEARLAVRGFRLAAAARAGGLLVTDGSRFASLSHVEPLLSGPKLARRFGETFHDHRQAHPEPPAVLPPGQVYAPRSGESLEQRAAVLLDRMTATHATFTESDLRRAAFYQPESVALVGEALRSDRVLDLGRGAGGAGRYTTRDYLDAEVRLLAAAAKLASRDRFRFDPAVVVPPLAPGRQEGDRLAAGGFEATARAAATLETASSDLSAGDLSAGQRAAVLHATTAADLAQIAGGDRAARAEAARAIAAAYREHGDEVRGAALTAKGASALAAATGVRSRTLATLEHAWAEGSGRLHARSVLLLEEAGLLDVRRLGGILAEAEERGAKVVLLGDPGQVQAIGAGDAYRGLLEQHPSACLDPGSGSEGLPVDRVYVLADPRMNRHAAEAALSRHRHGLDLFADRETFPSREHLDRVLSRPGPKDLAGDYAAAELRRAVSRLQDVAAKTAGATREELSLGKALAAHADLQRARLRVVDARRALAAPAAQAYVDPARALRDLLGDPAAADRLREGKARAYGNLRGHAVLGAASRARDEARQAVMTLSGRLYAYQHSLAHLRAAKTTFRAQIQSLARPGGPPLAPATGSASRELAEVAAARSPSAGVLRPAAIRHELAGVTATLRTYQQASRSAQDAIETAIRGLGPAASDSALLLLPPEAALPVQLAVRAVERALERGLDLGLDLVLGR
jgi:AAA domain/Relaxase/Mobilisation nuclease domain